MDFIPHVEDVIFLYNYAASSPTSQFLDNVYTLTSHEKFFA